jgi:hypothetical protein
MSKRQFAARENGHSESKLRLSAAGQIKLGVRYWRNSYRRKASRCEQAFYCMNIQPSPCTAGVEVHFTSTSTIYPAPQQDNGTSISHSQQPLPAIDAERQHS